MSHAHWARRWVLLVALLGACLVLGCARKQAEAVEPAAAPSETLVVLKGPDLSRRADSSVVVVEVDAPDGKRLGTAFAVDTVGLFVTNRHVVEGATYATIRGGMLAAPIQATVIFTSSICDLAVLHVAGLTLPPLSIARPNEAEVGEHVYAIGHPEGLEYSVSDGVVSGIRREAGEPTMVQFTASISHGSSGGPVLDEYGRVVGMSTLMMREGQNLNFAVPVEEIRNGVTTARSILLGGVDRTLVEGEAGFRTRYPTYAADVVLDSTTIVKLVDDLSNQGNRQTAWELARRGLTAFPYHYELHIAAEQVAFARNMYDDCGALLDRMTTLWPDSASTHNLRGDVLRSLNRFRQAHEEYALCIAATDPCTFWNRDSRWSQSLCSLQLANAQVAVDEMRPAMDCDDFASNGAAWTSFAVLLKNAEALDEADRAALRARRLLAKDDPSVGILNDFGIPRPVVVESKEQQAEYDGGITVRGIIRNQSGSMLTDVRVTAEGFNAEGQVVATGTTKVDAAWLLDGMTGPFKVHLEGMPDKVIRCDARVVYYK